MKRLSLIWLVVFTLVAHVCGQETVQTIPLDQIWGYNMPGTKDIAGIPLPKPKGLGETDARLRKQREQNIEQMRRALSAKPPTDRALPGFVIPRSPDFYTLREASTRAASAMLYEKGGFGDNVLRAESDMTLVFYSHPASYYVRLKKVERQGDELTVYYQFEPHASVESTIHFALIPLGTLPAGEYQVRFNQIPMDESYRETGFEPVHPEAFEIICRHFSFTIWEPPAAADEAPEQEAARIPLDRIWAYEMPGTRDIEHEVGENDMKLLASTTESWFLRAEKLKFKDVARHGFAVSGSGISALRGALATFNEGIGQNLLRDDEITIVFFSEPAGRSVQIREVQRDSSQFEIRYSIKPKSEGYRFNFALIPVGKLPVGEYQVEMRQLPHLLTPTETKIGYTPLDKEWSANFLSKPFKFTVTEKGE